MAVGITHGTLTSHSTSDLNITSSATSIKLLAAIDLTAEHFSEVELTITIVFPAGTPANGKAVFVYAGGYNGTDWTTPSNSGSAGAVTIPDFTTNPLAMRLIGTVPYNATAGETVTVILPVVATLGFLPLKLVLGFVNYSGATLTSGTVKYQTEAMA